MVKKMISLVTIALAVQSPAFASDVCELMLTGRGIGLWDTSLALYGQDLKASLSGLDKVVIKLKWQDSSQFSRLGAQLMDRQSDTLGLLPRIYPGTTFSVSSTATIGVSPVKAINLYDLFERRADDIVYAELKVRSDAFDLFRLPEALDLVNLLVAINVSPVAQNLEITFSAERDQRPDLFAAIQASGDPKAELAKLPTPEFLSLYMPFKHRSSRLTAYDVDFNEVSVSDPKAQTVFFKMNFTINPDDLVMQHLKKNSIIP